MTASGEIVDAPDQGSKRNTRYRPYAFLDQGVAMLSSVLHSSRAIQVNIALMRTFVKLRDILANQQDSERQFAELRVVQDLHANHIHAIWDAVDQLEGPAAVPPKIRSAFRRTE